MNDITDLQQAATSDITSNIQTGIVDQLSSMLMVLVIPSIILTLIIVVLYAIRIVHRYKVDKAIFEIRDTLREMKASQPAATIPPMPEPLQDTSSTPPQTD